MTHDELMKAASQFNENRLPVGLCSTLHQLKQSHWNETIMRVLCNNDNVNTIRVPVLLGFFPGVVLHPHKRSQSGENGRDVWRVGASRLCRKVSQFY